MVLIPNSRSDASYAALNRLFQRAAPVAQGIEQDGPNVKVGGSIPSGGTSLFLHQSVEALAC